MSRADHIYCNRVGYTHHGIDLGDGTVVHYTGEPGKKSNAAIQRTPIEQFMNGDDLHVQSYGNCDSPDVVIERAESRLSENDYNLVFNNCEHFAVWCKTGKSRSGQVERVAAGTSGTVGTGTAVAAGVGTVSAAGTVAGLSGSGIMSGLAAAGGLAGGGAVAGIVVLGAAPALATTGTMMYVMRDDPALPETEREARKVGKVATVAGAAGGSAASVAAITAAGISGVAAPGITTGLASIGGVVGGGMAAGVVITVAAPAVGAAAVGLGSYQLWKGYRAWQHGDFADVPIVRTPEVLREQTLSITADASAALKGAAAATAQTIGKGTSSASAAAGGLVAKASQGMGSMLHRTRHDTTSLRESEPQGCEENPDLPDA